MKDPEKAIDQVLAGLHRAETPAGMEARILRKLEQQTERHARRAKVVASPQSWRFAAGVAVILAFALSWRTHHEHATRRDSGSRHETATLRPTEEGETPATWERTSRTRVSPAPPTKPSVRSQPRPQQPAQLTVQVRSGHSRTPELAANDTQTVRDARAASHPAPALPLTEQEHLLLRLVHRSDRTDPEVLAVLNPALRARESQEERLEFDVFFASPATQEDEQQQPIPDERGKTQ